MSAKLDRSFAAPPNALSVWADSRYIYVLLPAKPGAEIPSPIMSIPRTAKGLAELVALVFGHADNSGSPQNFVQTRKLIGTPKQHGLAESILRRRGLIK
jgi:hypothetical protein